MRQTNQVHILDSNEKRRAELSYTLAQRAYSPRVYENYLELEYWTPQEGVIFASDRDHEFSLSNIQNLMRAEGVFLPTVVYGQSPKTSRIVQAMLDGAVDYLDWPVKPEAVERIFTRVHDQIGTRVEVELEKLAARKSLRELSNRESEVLIMIARGFSSKEIGKELEISPRTVEVHRSNILRKLSARTTPEAVRMAIYGGLGYADDQFPKVYFG